MIMKNQMKIPGLAKTTLLLIFVVNCCWLFVQAGTGETHVVISEGNESGRGDLQKEQCDANSSGECYAIGKEDIEVQTETDTVADIEDDPNCKDKHELCAFWAQAGECDKNPKYMKDQCRQSCKVCGKQQEWVYKDNDSNEISEKRDDASAQRFPEESFGVKQDISGTEAAKTRRVLDEAIEYMQNTVFANPDEYPREVREGCQNRNQLCAFWAAIGECEVNPGYMKLQCAPVCKTCDRVDFKKRCPYEPNDPKFPNAMEPGDLHKMFEKIVAPDSEFQKYKPVIHSRPYTPGAEGVEGQPMEAGQFEGPWVLTFDNFLTMEETDILIELGQIEGYERSTDVGARKFDGTYDKHESTGRTSHNAWCKEECMKNQTASEVMDRIVHTTGVPKQNSESFQLLRYELEQKYNEHHDFIGHQVDRQCGPRILTFFLYLSDVEEGGGTNFPKLGDTEEGGLTVMPKKGKALLWPSVVNDDLHKRDARTFHQALPVKAGTKYAANAWIHLRDFETANNEGCS